MIFGMIYIELEKITKQDVDSIFKDSGKVCILNGNLLKMIFEFSFNVENSPDAIAFVFVYHLDKTIFDCCALGKKSTRNIYLG